MKRNFRRRSVALTRAKTIVMIAHRLKTIRGAHQILVLDGDHIVQRDTHKELMEKTGLYADFIGLRRRAAHIPQKIR